jgi:hypothetical protein
MEKQNYYWINEQGVPQDISTMPMTYLRNVLRQVIRESMEKGIHTSVTTLKTGRKTFFAPVSKKKSWILWKLFISFVM